MKYLLSLALLCFFVGAQATQLPQEERVPGGIAILSLGAASQAKPNAQFQSTKVLVVEHQGLWKAIVGLPLSLSAGDYAITIEQQKTPISFQVADKAYPTQPLTVAPKYVNPPPEVSARIERESKLMSEAFARYTDPAPSNFIMKMPAKGPESSAFGLRRVFNGESRNPHSGLDIAAPEKSIVSTPMAGRVVLVGDFYFNGNTVIIDHGGGLLTLYCHLSRIDVKKDQWVTLDAPIGLVGATGRVTGPHLHFSVNLTGARINPSLFGLN